MPLSDKHNDKGGGALMADLLYSTALVFWTMLKIVVSNPLLLILALIAIAKRAFRS